MTRPTDPLLGPAWMAVPTVGGLLTRAAALWPDRDAVIFPDERRTFAELLDGAMQSARALHGLGVRRGDAVGILMPNMLSFLDVLFGSHLLGAVPVTVNARYKPRELRHVLADADLKVLVTTDLIAEYAPFVDLLERSLSEGRPPALEHLVMIGDSAPDGYVTRDEWCALASDNATLDVAGLASAVRLRDVAVVMYTSGTTSHPRGCPLTHESLARTAMCVAERFELTGDERFWDPLPLFHMAGLLPTVANLVRGGATLSMLHFDPEVALAQMSREGATFAYPAFPTITQALIHHPDFPASDLSKVRGILETGPPAYLRSVEASFPNAKVLASYGLTEAGGVISYSHLDESFTDRTETCGRPFPGMRLRIVDAGTGADCGPGVVGEIRVSGPGLFEGYLNDPGHTRERTDEQGYLCTGDLGTLDAEGRVAYVGRLKDMLKVGGENVAVLEIEAHLQGHPAVKIAQVVGLSDARLQQVPAAFVELTPGSEATAEELIAWCKDELASFKVPRHIRFVQEWPMSTTKIQKFQLREEIERLVNGDEAAQEVGR